MDLKEFVSKALRQIADGVSEAQSEVSEGVVVPGDRPGEARSSWGYFYDEVVFDVAVTASSEVEISAGAAAGLRVLGGKVDGSQTETEGSVSRIRFCVPIAHREKSPPIDR